MLEGSTLDQLPKDVLDQIWSIYSVWRNRKLWESRYQGFISKNKFIGGCKAALDVDKKSINICSDIIKYDVLDETKKFQNYRDMLFLKCTVDIEAYRITCSSCFKDTNMTVAECGKCGMCLCERCAHFGSVPYRRERRNGLIIIEKCSYCKED